MPRATKYIVVCIILWLFTGQTTFAQYNGGSGDGSHIDSYTLTVCAVPDQFYAYMGGNGDGFAAQTYTLTTCGTPAQFYAYSGGQADGFATQTYTLTSCGTPAQFVAYMGGNADGFAAQTYTLISCGTPSQFYAYMGGSGDGFARDTLTKCPTAPPMPGFTASSTTVCAGATINFTDTSTNSPSAWAWTFQGGTPPTSTVQNPSVVYNTPGTYSVSLVATNGMGSNTVTVTNYITVNAIPTANAGSDVAICLGSTTTLTATGGTTYSWTPSTGLSATNISNPVANPTVTTTYSVTVISGGCSSTDAMTVTVNPIPTANAGSDVAICSGSSTNLSASGGTSYSWTPSAGLNNAAVSNPVASPTVTTTYSVTVTAAGCSATDDITVTVNSLPIVNAGSDVAFCNGGSTNLSASGGLTYTWSPATGLSATNIANPVAAPGTTINYTVIVSDVNNCQASDEVLITVHPLPAANAGLDVTICTGNSANLSASGGTSYTWTPATGLSATNIANPIASPTTTTSYTVLVTDNNSCQASDEITVTVTGALVANAGNDTSICFGSSVGLSAGGGTTYTWTPSTGLSATNIANPTASHTATITYTVTVSSGACSASDDITVTVNPLPTPTITAGGPTTFCAGDSVILTSNLATTYTWSAGGNNQTLTVLTPGTYSVTVTDALGCLGTSNAISVAVNPIGTASITPNGPTTFCQGGSVLLTANSGSGYTWTGGATTQTISVTTSGTYSVAVDDPNGCAVPSPTTSIVITVNPNPPTPTIVSTGTTTSLCIGDTVVFTCDSAASYLWSTGATVDSIIVSTPGSYSVTVFNSFGCSAGSAAVSVSVDNPLSDFVADSLLVFIPNAVVNFTATTTGIPPYTYNWSFGDGGTSSASTPTHTYTTIGYDTVSLTVIDSAGCSNTITKNSYIEVEQLFPSTPMVTGTSLNLTGVSFLDAQTGIVTLTDGNCILSVDSGNTFTPLPTGNTNALTGAAVLPGNWFVTGANGTIMLSVNNGLAWSAFSTGTTETFNGSNFSSSANGFAVGTNGTVQMYNGSNWTPQVSGTPEHLNNVAVLSNGNAVAVGENQTIIAYNGISWSAQTCPLTMNVKDVRFTTLTNGYAVGTGGNVLQTNNGGATWNPVLTGVDIDFNSIEAKGPDSAWATGTHGIVYTTIDNGVNWVRWSVGYTDDQSCLRVTSNKGHIVGAAGNGRNFQNTGGIGIFNAQSQIKFFTLYPSPAGDEFTISGFISGTERLSIDIKDVQGRVVKKVMDREHSGQLTINVNTSSYSDGVYFVHVKEASKSWVQKIVIGH